MKVSIKKSLIVYCYKADNYNEFKRRVFLLIMYIQKQNDTRLIQFMIKDFQNKEIIL
jgi:hypothetical protein